MVLGSFAFAAMVALAFGRWIADGFNAVFAKWRKLGFLGRIVAASFTVIATVEAQKEEGNGGRGMGNGGVGRGENFNAESQSRREAEICGIGVGDSCSGRMEGKKTKVLILICSILSATWLFVAGGIKYEAILDFCFSYADENAQIDNERMRWQTEGSVKKFLTEVSLQRIWRQFCENNVDYYISKEVVSNVVFGCEIKGVDKEMHMYQIKLVAPSKMLADKTVQFIFLTYQKSLEERVIFLSEFCGERS